MSAQGLVIQAAQSQLFVVEKGGSDGKSGNIVPYWEWWQNETGQKFQGASWCAVFVSWCFAQHPQTANLIPAKNAHGFIYCPDLENYAKKKNLVIDAHHAQAGDIALFDFAGAGIADHVEIIEKPLGNNLIQTIGGNTSPQGAVNASQSNGGGVYRRQRPIDKTLRLVVRPPYPTLGR